MTAQRFLSLLGPSLAVGAGVAVALALADRILGLPLGPWAVFAAPAGAALAFAIAAAWSRRTDRLTGARTLDERLGLKDRLGSAMSLMAHEQTRRDPFAMLAAEDAESRAQAVDVRRATPLRLGASWWSWPLIAALGAVAWIAIPEMNLLARESQARRERERIAREERIAAVQEIEQVREETAAALRAGGEAAPEPPSLELLDQIAEDLASGARSADDARAEAAAALEREAEQRRAQAQSIEQSLQAVAERAAGASDDLRTEQARSLAEALEDGDLDAAASEAERIAALLESEAGRSLPAEDRERLAQDLDRLADRLEQSGGDGDAMESVRQSLEQQGLSGEQASDLANSGDPRAVEQALRERGVSPDAAQRIAEQAQQAREQEQASRMSKGHSDDLAESLRRAAEEARNPQPPEQQPGPSAQTPDGQPRDGSRQSREQGAQGEQPNRQGSETGGPQDQGSERDQQDQQGEGGTQQGSGQQQGSREQGGGQQGSSGGRSQGEQPGGAQSGGSQSGGSEQGGGQQGSGGGSGAQGVQEAIERMRDQQRGASQSRGEAQRMEDQARRLLGQNSGGGQGNQIGQGGSGVGRSGDPSLGAERPMDDSVRFEDVDARRSAEGGRTAAEWTNPDAPDAPRYGAQPTVESARESARAAERAIEDQAVSPRHSRLLREFFRRRLERAEDRTTPAPAPDSDATPADAPAESGGDAEKPAPAEGGGG